MKPRSATGRKGGHLLSLSTLKICRSQTYNHFSISVSFGTLKQAGASGKMWLEPAIEKAYLSGFTNGEEKDILKIMESHSEYFKTKWYEYFSK